MMELCSLLNSGGKPICDCRVFNRSSKSRCTASAICWTPYPRRHAVPPEPGSISRSIIDGIKPCCSSFDGMECLSVVVFRTRVTDFLANDQRVKEIWVELFRRVPRIACGFSLQACGGMLIKGEVAVLTDGTYYEIVSA